MCVPHWYHISYLSENLSLMIVLDDSLVHLAGIFHNMYLKLEESEDDHYLNDDGWKFHIHDVNEVPILAVTTHGTSLYPGQGRDLRLDMKKVHTSQWKNLLPSSFHFRYWPKT